LGAEEPTLKFWRSYAALLPPAREQTSLLFLSEDELSALEDAELTRRARQWRAKVEGAHAEFFPGGAALTLDDLVWGVGLAESRAFSVRAEGAEHVVAMPFIDMVNYEPHPLTLHVDRGDRFELRGLGAQPGPGVEATISYGNKPNQRLMEQYGFVLCGNPFDRIPFPEPAELSVPPLTRDKLIAALGFDGDYGGRPPEMEALHEAAAQAARAMAPPEPNEALPWTEWWGPAERRRFGAATASLLEKVRRR